MKVKFARAGWVVMVGWVATVSWAQTCNPATTPTAPNSRFVIQPGGSEVLDKATGLYWRRCVIGQTWSGSTCAGTPELLSWPAALARAKELGPGWRLPNVKELVGLAEMSCEPALNLSIFPTDFIRLNSAGLYLWTSTPAQDEAKAYVVSGWRLLEQLTGNESAQVRAVR